MGGGAGGGASGGGSGEATGDRSGYLNASSVAVNAADVVTVSRQFANTRNPENLHFVTPTVLMSVQ